MISVPLSQPGARTLNLKANICLLSSTFSEGWGLKHLPRGSQEGLEAPLCLILMKHLATKGAYPL